jgi:hypothetical protein
MGGRLQLTTVIMLVMTCMAVGRPTAPASSETQGSGQLPVVIQRNMGNMGPDSWKREISDLCWNQKRQHYLATSKCVSSTSSSLLSLLIMTLGTTPADAHLVVMLFFLASRRKQQESVAKTQRQGAMHLHLLESQGEYHDKPVYAQLFLRYQQICRLTTPAVAQWGGQNWTSLVIPHKSPFVPSFEGANLVSPSHLKRITSQSLDSCLYHPQTNHFILNIPL